jgi:uncharacterized repeat protein (TIGR01451 family)
MSPIRATGAAGEGPSLDGIASKKSGSRRALGALLAACAALCAFPAAAQVQRSYLNSGFETPALVAANPANGCYRQLDEALVPGWTTTHPSQSGSGDCTSPGASTGRLLEMWRTNFQGVVSREGNNFVELNAEASSRLYQNVCLVNGDSIRWRFSHRGRGSATVADVAAYNVGASVAIATVSTTNNGTMPAGTPVANQGTVNAVPAAVAGWRDYSGTFSYTGASGVTSMGFESISTGSGSNTVGNFLDNIQIELAPFVEFTQPSSSTPESASSNLPTLRVNGTVLTPFTVTVTITGGTATLGTDYTTPGNSSTINVTIPAAVYDGVSASSLFALPIAVTQDALVEGNETIQLQIQPPTGTTPPFLLRSNTTCGAAAQSTWIYTIVDDDARISVTKNAATPVAVAGQPTQYDVAYTIAVTNTTPLLAANYSLADTPGFDSDVSIVSANVALNGGAATALTGSGPWTLQPQWKALAAGVTDTYVLTVRINIARGGSAANDTCAAPSVAGSGLHNNATATVQALIGTNPTFSATACRNTPTPVWAVLRKNVTARAVATDQFQIRMLSAGTSAATATTSGAGATAATALVVLPAGNTLQFDEALKANGTGADQVPSSYASTIVCSNASAGSTTVLPAGAGSNAGSRRQWSDFTPAAGDDIDCTITNTPLGADLAITKTNTPALGANDQPTDTVTRGAPTTYQIVVTNNGPGASNNAVLRDPATASLSCTSVACAVGGGGATCPAVTVAALQSASGITLPTLPVGSSLIFTLTCDVQ